MTLEQAIEEARKHNLKEFTIPSKYGYKHYALFDGKFREVVIESENPRPKG